jgi:hypothetical protein
LWRNYGITVEYYNVLLAGQSGKCAICGLVPLNQCNRGRLSGRLHVDHDHDTNEIRGLLCSNCNTGIGLLGDNRETVFAAVHYLDVHQERLRTCAFE